MAPPTASRSSHTPPAAIPEPAHPPLSPQDPARALTGPIILRDRKTKCVDDNNDSSANGTKIVIWDCKGNAQQKWTIKTDGTIGINGKCMAIAGDGPCQQGPGRAVDLQRRR